VSALWLLPASLDVSACDLAWTMIDRPQGLIGALRFEFSEPPN
jgi:hypothetical protein